MLFRAGQEGCLFPVKSRNEGRGTMCATITFTTPPWQGWSGRWFVVRFHDGPGRRFRAAGGGTRPHAPGSCTFKLQTRSQGDASLGSSPDDLGRPFGDDGEEEDPTPVNSKNTRGADQRESNTHRKKAAVVAELRDLESNHADRLWHMACRVSSTCQGRRASPNPTSFSGSRNRGSTSRLRVMP